MSYKILYLPLALADVRIIRTYLLQFYQSTADKFLAELKEHLLVLQDMPYMCEAYIERPTYRKMVIADYLIFYKVNEENNIIEIHRILHSTVDISKYLHSCV